MVVVGLHEINQTIPIESTDLYFVEKIFEHPSAIPGTPCDPFNVMILKLTSPVVYTDKAQAICLPASRDDAVKIYNESVVFVGW